MAPHRTALLPAAALAMAMAMAACDRAAPPAPQAAAPTAVPIRAPASNGIVSAPPASRPAAGAPLPADVQAFRAEREQCDHFRGEEPYDAKRAAELKRQLDRFCKGTDARLAALRRKYAAEPAVGAALGDLEDQVE